jgi:hypothetical protein
LGLVATTALLGGGLTTTASSASPGDHAKSAPQAAPAATCRLGNGTKHLIEIVFDNIHFFRDNPNVPSDVEQMPHLLNFLKANGTVLSNTHTPLIAHTADDSLTIYTGLYGDRHGQPVSNSYKTFNPAGTTDPAASFAYWTDPVDDTAATPAVGHDTTPSMVYSAKVPATSTKPNKITPAPWVPFTRAGCDVGDFSTANMVLENTKLDIPTVFGPHSPEQAQQVADPDPFKDDESADYTGIAVHCAKGSKLCTKAMAVKFGHKAPSHVAVPDLLPTEPGGYHGFPALFGNRYVAPQLGQGHANVKHHGYPVTNASGNLTDINGAEIDNEFTGKPGFPGFDPSAAQSLGYLADMQEAGIPVTYGYVSDLHERKAGSTSCTTVTATKPENAIGPGDSCFVANTKAYDLAFAKFFARLKADGITPANTTFIIGTEENDQFAGANVGREIQPTPAGCNGVTVPCAYPTGTLGELQANIKGLLATSKSATTPFDIEPQGASIYVHGKAGAPVPTASAPAVRQLERDTAAMTANDPYTGLDNEKVVNYQAGTVEQRILHMRSADPLRLPTYTLFPKPDYFFSTTGANVSINPAFAWNHGYYSPNIDITWEAFVGPQVAAHGIDGPSPRNSPETRDPNSVRTVPEASLRGTWVDETDVRPTLLSLVGLTDDYQTDGRVITQILRHEPTALSHTEDLAACYKQLNSAVGDFGTDTLMADSKALASGSSTSDTAFKTTEARLLKLANRRDALATKIKVSLSAAAFHGHAPLATTLASQAKQCQALLDDAAHLLD